MFGRTNIRPVKNGLNVWSKTGVCNVRCMPFLVSVRKVKQNRMYYTFYHNKTTKQQQQKLFVWLERYRCSPFCFVVRRYVNDIFLEEHILFSKTEYRLLPVRIICVNRHGRVLSSLSLFFNLCYSFGFDSFHIFFASLHFLPSSSWSQAGCKTRSMTLWSICFALKWFWVCSEGHCSSWLGEHHVSAS